MPHISVSSEREPDLQSQQALRSGRDPFWENARLALMGLVVFGHLLEPWLSVDRWARALYVMLYAFHIPAFAFVAGRFARVERSLRSIGVAAGALLVPYAVFQPIYGGGWQWWRPEWVLWFLVSLFCWRAALPWVVRVRWAGLWLVAAALAAGASESIGYGLSLSRTLVFFPFFYVGNFYGQQVAGWLRPRTGWVVLAVGVGGAAWLAPRLDVRWLYGSNPYAWLGVGVVRGALIRAGMMVGAAVLGLAFLAVVPRGRGKLTPMGGRTMTLFLVHGLVLRAWTGWTELAAGRVAVAAVGACGLTLLLGSEWVAAWLRPVVDPIGFWSAVRRGRLRETP